MLRGLQGERIRQAFHYFDKDGDGYIEPEDFQRIILQTARHKLSDHLLENLHTLCNISSGSKISYANVRAFQNMIREMDLVEMILRHATAHSTDGKITRTEFLNEAARITRFSLFTPMEADILFHFASLDEPSGRLGLSDFAKVIDPSWRNPLYNAFAPLEPTQIKTTGQNFLHSVLESVHHFGLGSLAGAFGAFVVYPIDLVKTRMQNQRSSRVGQMLYKNSWDCAKKVVRNEGFKGLYSGVVPQLIGVAPEKAIKLTVNDLVRGHFSSKDGKIWIPHEILAGGTAGACQVVSKLLRFRLELRAGPLSSVALTRDRYSPILLKSSRSAYKSKERSLNPSRVRQGVVRCGSSRIWVSSVSTKALQHVSYAMSHFRLFISQLTTISSVTTSASPRQRNSAFCNSLPQVP